LRRALAKRWRKMVPTRDECLRLMAQYGMLNNIVHHSLEVTKVALFISVELNKKGQRIDLGLVEAASLLHDLTKTECLETKEDHAQTGFLLLKKIGYQRVGEIVAEHIQVSKRKDSLMVSEEEVVNYADKRVQHARIVSLEERFKDLRNRYGEHGKTFRALEELEKLTSEIEFKIFSILGIDPNDLEHLQREES
jgi:uncharacterized protein